MRSQPNTYPRVLQSHFCAHQSTQRNPDTGPLSTAILDPFFAAADKQAKVQIAVHEAIGTDRTKITVRLFWWVFNSMIMKLHSNLMSAILSPPFGMEDRMKS